MIGCMVDPVSVLVVTPPALMPVVEAIGKDFKMQADSYAGQMLWVDLGTGKLKSKPTNKDYLKR